MKCVLQYLYTAEGAWYPEQMTVTGAGGLLPVRKSVRTQAVFSEYWRLQAG